MLIDRYVFRELAAPTLMGLVVWTLLFLVHWFYRLARQWSRSALEFEEIFEVLLYLMPSLLTQAIPMAVLLGIVIGFSRLSADAELTALRSAGVSYYRLLVPTLVLAVIAWIATSAVYLWAVPLGNQAFMELNQKAVQRADVNREIEPGTWQRLEEGTALHARGLDTSNPAEPWLRDVNIFLLETGSQRREHIHAERARFSRLLSADGSRQLQLELEDVQGLRWEMAGNPPVRYSTESATRALRGQRNHTGRRATRSVRKTVRMRSLAELRESLVDLDEMDAVDALADSDPELHAERKSEMALAKTWVPPQVRPTTRRQTLMEINKKFSIPAACLVLALAGMPLGIATRRGGKPAAFVVAIGVIAIWWLVFVAGDTWMEAGKLKPIAAAWLPDVVVGLMGIYLIVRLRTQQRVGIYRALRHGLLLSSGVFLLVAGLVGLARFNPMKGDPIPGYPFKALAASGVLMFCYLLAGLFRDPISRLVARILGAFRSGGQRPTRPGVRLATDITSEVPAHRSNAPAILLRQFRRLLILSVLAVTAFCVQVIVTHPVSAMAGFIELREGWQPWFFLVAFLLAVLLQRAGAGVLKILDAWILGSYLKVLGLVVGSMVMLFFVTEYVSMSADIYENGIQSRVVLDYFKHRLPQMLLEVLPYSAMIAALAVLGIMTKFNETVALRCCGVSVFRIALPILFVATLISGGVFVVHDYVLPEANRISEGLKDEIRGRSPRRRAGGRRYVFARDGRSLYQFDQILIPDALRSKAAPVIVRVTALRMAPNHQVESINFAQRAVWNGTGWVLQTGWLAQLDAEEVEVVEYRKKHSTEMEEPDYFANETADPNELTAAEFLMYIQDQKAAGYSTGSLEAQYHRKLAVPAQCLVLVLVGIPFAFTTGRKGALYGVGIALLLGIGFLASSYFFAVLGEAEQLPPVVAAWAANILFGLAGLFRFLSVRT